MKRAIAFVTALVITAGAVAPAVSVFADDLPATYSGSNIISFDDLDDDTFDMIFQAFDDSQLYDRDSWINKTLDAIGANMVALGNQYPLLETFFEDVPGVNVLYGTSKLKWLFQNVGIDTTTGEIVSLGDDMTTDVLDEYLNSTLMSPGSSSGDHISVGSGQWLVGVPINYSTSSPSSTTWTDTNLSDVYSTWAGDKYLVICTTGSSGRIFVGSVDNNYVNVSTAYTGSVSSGYYGNYRRSYGTGTSIAGFSSAQYSSVNAAVADFFGNALPSSEPVWNGSGYYDSSRQFKINIPALPSVDWDNLSHQYYIDYGESYTDSSTVNNFYYDISNNYAPYEVTYDLPYWLINGNTSIETFDYSLQLPSAPLETLPEDFEGGGSFFQNAFLALGSFGGFVLLGLSFSLVGLFFKE